MKKTILRNIAWIALIAVWSFLAGAYFHLGWMREPSMSFLKGFIIGGIGVWVVFSVMGILVYRFAKKNRNQDPAKPALYVVSFFTICFLLIAWIKYDDVQKDKFIEDLEYNFIVHYKNKASVNGVEIDDLDRELERVYFGIHSDLRRHPRLDDLMQQKTADAVFEENPLISELCTNLMEMYEEIGYPSPAEMYELFE